MRLQFDFRNEVPSVDVNVDMIQATPIELLVSDVGSPHSRRKALGAYLRTLDYMFRGVSNLASTDIVRSSVEKGWFGKMEKSMHAVNWTAIVDKSFVVIYDITLKSITENMYIADGIKISKDVKDKKNVEPLWLKELMSSRSLNSRLAKEFMIHAIQIATRYSDNYRLVFGHNGQERLSILDNRGNEVSVNSIQDDETFILYRMLFLLLTKGLHFGVFLIDCTGFSNKTLEALSEISKLFFEDSYMFLYNCPRDATVERITVELPNFTLGPKKAV